MVTQYLRLSSWIKAQLEIATHYDVPLGNLGADPGVFLADIDFARRLKGQDMILWWSPAPLPDLGGSEGDNNAPEELVPTNMLMKGTYSSVVLEMEVADLAINSILQSALVNEMEGSGTGSMAFDSASHNLDEYAKGTANSSVMLGDAVLSTQTFGVLKTMIRSWFLDKARAHVKGTHSSPADLVVDQFWRWISSPSSNMFEPALHRFLHGLMRKVFLQLLAEFKRLGTQVVYADFNRIFLLTTKPDAGSAYAFARYLVTAANSQELFRHLVIDVNQFWNYLTFMDVANFGGVKISPEQAASREAPSSRFDISMDWNIQSFLPGSLQPIFERNVASFIFALYSAKRNATDGRAPLRPIHNLNIDQPGEITSVFNPAKDLEHKAAKKSISQTLTRRLLTDIAAVKKRQQLSLTDEDEAAALAFPSLPGSRLASTSTAASKNNNPALELVKSICEVYALSSEHNIEIQVLKRNLLDLLGVREFSAVAAFKNPCESVIVPSVICRRCNAIRDVDLCRDPDRLPGVDPDSGEVLAPAKKTWVCHVSCLFRLFGMTADSSEM
jgi:DNA polymerase epsilon subunit 1